MVKTMTLIPWYFLWKNTGIISMLFTYNDISIVSLKKYINIYDNKFYFHQAGI